jgi:hypothetical protein
MVKETTAEQALRALEAFVGEWDMTSSVTPGPAEAPRARTTLEWLSGRRFLVQRWEVEHPDAPDGIAVIGFDSDRAIYLQHYFDSRGVARVYEMTFAHHTWTVVRLAAKPDFSPRFTGTFTDRDTIVGRWEISNDGSEWVDDFGLTYTRVGARIVL